MEIVLCTDGGLMWLGDIENGVVRCGVVWCGVMCVMHSLVWCFLFSLYIFFYIKRVPAKDKQK